MLDGPLELSKYKFDSRLLVGTGKYKTFDIMKMALEASGAEIVTVAIRRVNVGLKYGESMLDHIDKDKYMMVAEL